MKYLLVSILLTFSVLKGLGQTLDEQFKELRDNSETFKVYKVIKQTDLNAFWGTVLDSLQNNKSKYVESQATIKLQENSISELTNTISTKDEEVSGLKHDTEHIRVLGIDFSKATYISITFIIIAGLIALVAILFQRFSNSNSVAAKKTTAYEKLDQEFEMYKRDSLEKQMRLRRDLQTERNKIEEIRNS